MQIRMFTDNHINITVGRAAQERRQHMQTQIGPFDGPQCKVTISKEGRKLSEQSDRQPEKSIQLLKAERMMQQESDEKKLSETTQSEYSDLIKEIDKTIKSMKNSNTAGEDLETLKRKQEAIRSISDQKQKQQEENQKRAKEAQRMAMQSSEMQDEIDQGNRDLLVMLKSIEESEEAEEEREDGKSESGRTSDAKRDNSVSDTIADSATQFAASSRKRELDVAGLINQLKEDGYNYLARADELEQNLYDESQRLGELLDSEEFTNDEKKAAVISYGSKMARDSAGDLEIILGENYTDDEKERALESYRSAMRSKGDYADYRRRGMQMIRDAKDCEREHIATNPLQGMEETRDSMIQSAVDAAFNEASQGRLDEASQELEDEVKDLIDKRNDIDNVASEEKKDEEEEKEIGGVPEPKKDPEKAEENPENSKKAEEEKMEEKIIIAQG